MKRALLSLPRPGEMLTNAQFRERLKASGYPHPASPMHIRKTLIKIEKAGALVAQRDADSVAYGLPKKG